MKTLDAVEFHADKVRETFSLSADSYAGHFGAGRTGRNFCFRRRLEIAAEVTRGSGGRLLDCATGTGDITGEVLRAGTFAHATLVDVSDEMLTHCHTRMQALDQRHSTSLEFVSSDIFHFLVNRRGRYDVILCLGLIAHTGRLTDLLQRLKPCLSRDGRILLQTTLLDHWGTRIVRALTQRRYQRRHGYRISYFRGRDVDEAIRRAEMRVREIRRFAVSVPFADRLAPAANYRLEHQFQGWAGRHGAEAIYVISNS